MQLGMIGLGRMGANLVERLTRGGHECVVFDIDASAVASGAGKPAQASTAIAGRAAQPDKPRPGREAGPDEGPGAQAGGPTWRSPGGWPRRPGMPGGGAGPGDAR